MIDISSIKPFNRDWFHGYLISQLPEFRYTEIHQGKIISTNTKSDYHIVFYYEEATENHARSIENFLNYNFFKNKKINIDDIANETIVIFEDLKKEFFNNEDFKLTESEFNILKGCNWKDYSSYINDKDYYNKLPADLKKEIINFELDKFKITKQQESNYVKNFLKKLYTNLKISDNYIESLDRKKTLFLTDMELVADYLTNKGFKCLHTKIFHFVLGDFIVANNIVNDKKNCKNTERYSFMCLNRTFKRHRGKVIEEINQNHLTNHGYITQYCYPYKSKLLKQRYKNVLYHNMEINVYKKRKDQYPAWKNHDIINGIECSSNLSNLINDISKINALTQIVVESDIASWVITEKSFQPFFSKNIPLIIGFPGINCYLESLGFDLFTDIVNYNYDKITDDNLRIKAAISDNFNLLSTYYLKDINDRLEKNRIFLLNYWSKKFMDDLINDIRKSFN